MAWMSPLCSRNAQAQKALVGCAQWGTQPVFSVTKTSKYRGPIGGSLAQQKLHGMIMAMKAPLGKGIFLIAAPSLRDANFRQTVVLLCEHGADGALGVVVNRPTAMSVSEALPQVPILEGQQHVLFSGGPVQMNQVMILYRVDQFPENSHHVFDGICLGGDAQLVDRILTASAGRDAFRAYLGYSGWGPGQLESEMQTGSWFTIPADSNVVFDKDPTRVWADIVSALGDDYRLYADMPFDPSLN